jgi:hypothetical protein
MTVKFKLDNKTVANETVLLFKIKYDDQVTDDPDQTRGRTNPKVYTYAMLKAGGLWYVTGSGRVPVAAGWGAIERWLEREGREVISVEAMTGKSLLWAWEDSE